MTAEEIERRRQEDLELIRNFRLIDDEFMTKCFDKDPIYIQEVLRVVMDMPDLEVVDVRTQVFVENLPHRSVRLDVKAHDAQGKWMNVEIQRRDQGGDRRRSRYHSSMMDVGLLEKGRDFKDLPDVWVIFITEHDVMGQGEPVYQIERCNVKTGERFQDGSHILYVNGAYRGNDKYGELMHDFFCTNADEMYNETLADRVRFFKEDNEGVEMMCKSMEDRINRAAKEAKKEQAIESALRMLKPGRYTDEEITEITGLTLTEVKKLKAEAVA